MVYHPDPGVFRAQDFWCADFDKIPLAGASFGSCKFRHASFSDASAEGARFEDCTFDHCYFQRADLRNARFERCWFTDCDFRAAKLRKAAFTLARMTRVCFQDADLQGAYFYQSTLRDLGFRGTQVEGLVIDDCEVEGSHFRDSKGVIKVRESRIVQLLDYDICPPGRDEFLFSGAPIEGRAEEIFTEPVVLLLERGLPIVMHRTIKGILQIPPEEEA